MDHIADTYSRAKWQIMCISVWDCNTGEVVLGAPLSNHVSTTYQILKHVKQSLSLSNINKTAISKGVKDQKHETKQERMVARCTVGEGGQLAPLALRGWHVGNRSTLYGKNWVGLDWLDPQVMMGDIGQRVR